MCLTNHSIYCHYSSNKTTRNWNRTITRISRITFKRIPCTCKFSTLGSYPYLQFFSVLLSTDAPSADTGLEDITPQIYFSTPTALCSSAGTIPLDCTVHTDLLWHNCPSLAVHWHYIPLITFIQYSPLFQLVLDIPV